MGNSRQTCAVHLEAGEMNIIEFFFCPVHGLLRPANWGLVGWMLSDAGLLVQMWMSRIMGWKTWEKFVLLVAIFSAIMLLKLGAFVLVWVAR